jgi:hypothetical protein
MDQPIGRLHVSVPLVGMLLMPVIADFMEADPAILLDPDRRRLDLRLDDRLSPLKPTDHFVLRCRILPLKWSDVDVLSWIFRRSFCGTQICRGLPDSKAVPSTLVSRQSASLAGKGRAAWARGCVHSVPATQHPS